MQFMYTYMPRWMTERAIYLYIAVVLIASVLFAAYSISWYYMLFGVVEVVGFFYVSNKWTKEWSIDHMRDTTFANRLFYSSLIIRVVYVLFSYWFYTIMTGAPMEFAAADSYFYHTSACEGARLLREGILLDFWHNFNLYMGTDISDTGYAAYLSFVYFLTGDSILVSRLVKACWSALTVLLIYRLTERNFGQQTARMAGIFCMLMPNLIYYCGLQLKEVEMVFLTVLMVDMSDKMFRSRNFTAWQVIPVLLIGGMLFTIRTALAIVALLAILFTIVMASDRVMGWGKRIIIGLLAVMLIGVTVGNRIQENARELVESVQSRGQQTNMKWRAQRENGNKFAEYAGAAVFAPLIFTIPFPTVVNIPEQENQLVIHGGNFVKNVMSGLVILAMFSLLLTGNWRKCAMPLSFMLGYLVVLVFSSFAQSERFHQPALPFELLFAAYGISLVGKREKRWFNYWVLFLFAVDIFWQWFKLAGRNMV